jgi:hypothetical protein
MTLDCFSNSVCLLSSLNQLSDLLDYENAQIAHHNEVSLNKLVQESKDENSKMRLLTVSHHDFQFGAKIGLTVGRKEVPEMQPVKLSKNCPTFILTSYSGKDIDSYHTHLLTYVGCSGLYL